MILRSRNRDRRPGASRKERVLHGRRIEDDEVVAAGARDVVELLRRHVLVVRREAVGDVLVDVVVEDPAPCRVVGRHARDQALERRARVEHQCVQLPGCGAEIDPHFVVPEPLETERVREPPRRIDRQHEHARPRAA
jgi:hypothetical protein